MGSLEASGPASSKFSLFSFRKQRKNYREYSAQLTASHTSEAAGSVQSEDERKLKEQTRYYYERIYERAAAMSRDKNFWNFGYSSPATLERIRERIPEFGSGPDTDGFSEQLYFYTVMQLPLTFEELAGMSLLDIGCGGGEGVNFLSRTLPATRMIGLDLSHNAVDWANARFSRDSRLSYIYGDAENVPVGDGELDVVINVESAHTYPDNRRFLEEVARVLKPGGFFSQVDVYSHGAKWTRTRSTRSEVEQLEWIRDEDISAEVKASIRSRCRPGSFFHRQFDSVPWLYRAYIFRHFSFLYGRIFAEIPDDNYIKLLRRLRIFPAGENETIPPGACYRYSLARKR